MPKDIFCLEINDSELVNSYFEQVNMQHVPLSPSPRNKNRRELYLLDEGLMDFRFMDLSAKSQAHLAIYATSKHNLELLARKQQIMYWDEEVKTIKKIPK